MGISKVLSAIAAIAAVALADVPPPGPDGRYTLTSEGIRAQFIPYAATLTNLFVKDKNGVETDVVLGYDNASFYPADASHPVYNAVPGRYANRIGNGMFTLDNVTYHLTKNDGNNTLHSGPNNWSYRFWNVSAVTNTSITFSMHDAANSTGMPGRVLANVTYTLSPYTWHINMAAVSPDVRTPIMLTQHTYFNLDAFKNPATDKIWNHTVHMPYSRRYLDIDGGALPTGEIFNSTFNDTNDFWSTPHQLGFASGNDDFPNHCGSGCNGYNTEWILDGTRPPNATVVTLSSDYSGIKAEMQTNQAGIMLYTCYWDDGTTPMKRTQGIAGRSHNVTSSGCVAIEAQDYVDGINHPQWGRLGRQIFGPNQTYVWESSWRFGLTSPSNATKTTVRRSKQWKNGPF